MKTTKKIDCSTSSRRNTKLLGKIRNPTQKQSIFRPKLVSSLPKSAFFCENSGCSYAGSGTTKLTQCYFSKKRNFAHSINPKTFPKERNSSCSESTVFRLFRARHYLFIPKTCQYRLSHVFLFRNRHKRMHLKLPTVWLVDKTFKTQV